MSVTRLEKLRKLESDLAVMMEKANSRAYPQLARQYRETIREIDELESEVEVVDEIGEIIARSKARGKAGPD